MAQGQAHLPVVIGLSAVVVAVRDGNLTRFERIHLVFLHMVHVRILSSCKTCNHLYLKQKIVHIQ